MIAESAGSDVRKPSEMRHPAVNGICFMIWLWGSLIRHGGGKTRREVILMNTFQSANLLISFDRQV